MAVAAGLEPDGDRPVLRRLARELGRRAELVLRIEEEDGDLGVGGQAVQLEPAVVDVAVESPADTPPWPRLRLEEDPAEHPGLPDGLAVRPDDPALHGRAAAERDVDLRASVPGFRSQGMKAWAYQRRPPGRPSRIIRSPISWST